MKLWLIEQEENTGYDTYDSAVVAAETAKDASMIHPSGYVWLNDKWTGVREDGGTYEIGRYSGWTWPEKVTTKIIGDAMPGTEKGVVLASFNAG